MGLRKKLGRYRRNERRKAMNAPLDTLQQAVDQVIARRRRRAATAAAAPVEPEQDIAQKREEGAEVEG